MKENVADSWWRTAKQNDRSRYDKQYQGLRFKVRDSVLEIGGGNGSFLDWVGVKNAAIIDVGGKDSVKNGYKFIEADITKKLPKLRKKFKTIFLMEVLEHIKNPLYVMAQVYDLLEDEGTCYVAVPYTKLDTNREGQANPYNCHVVRWTKAELIDDMLKLGFRVKVIQQRRRFKNTAFYLPHCWIVLELKKRLEH